MKALPIQHYLGIWMSIDFQNAQIALSLSKKMQKINKMYLYFYSTYDILHISSRIGI